MIKHVSPSIPETTTHHHTDTGLLVCSQKAKIQNKHKTQVKLSRTLILWNRHSLCYVTDRVIDMFIAVDGHVVHRLSGYALALNVRQWTGLRTRVCVCEVVTRTICSLMARGRTCSVFSFG